MRLFIYKYWDSLCENISKEYNTIKADEINDNLDTNWLLIKHDVETNVPKALKLAQIEHKYNIKATYYIQADLVEENHKTLQEIASLGHEVSYHYDVLDEFDGDMIEARESFVSNIEMFNRYGFDIKSICPHGNPIKIRDGWSSNKDFFRDRDIQKDFSDILDIVVALPNILDSYSYISDAGYSFKLISDVANNDKKESRDKPISNLLDNINPNSKTILSTHPHRWESSSFKFILKVYGFKIIKTVAKKLLKIPILERLMSKYYYLAKRV